MSDGHTDGNRTWRPNNNPTPPLNRPPHKPSPTHKPAGWKQTPSGASGLASPQYDRSYEKARPLPEPDIKDAAGKNCYVNDTIWFANDEGVLREATIVEVFALEGTMLLMTKSNSMVELPFPPKSTTVPSCNLILKA